MESYIGILHKEPGSCYGISFPDFPGCISAGDTLQEALMSGAEALGSHVRWMRLDGEVIPTPADLDNIMADPDFADGMPAVITPSLRRRSKSGRISVSLEEHLVAEVDAQARRFGITRSAFVSKALSRALHSPWKTSGPAS